MNIGPFDLLVFQMNLSAARDALNFVLKSETPWKWKFEISRSAESSEIHKAAPQYIRVNTKSPVPSKHFLALEIFMVDSHAAPRLSARPSCEPARPAQPASGRIHAAPSTS